jgi:DNA-binding response OmpR family regulator
MALHHQSQRPPGRILVVDDEASIRTMLMQFLEQAGFEVRTCQDGQTALKVFATEHFDAILLDLHMPGMSGLETAAVMRQRNPTIPIALMTAMAGALDPEDAICAGISHVFAKPFNLRELTNWLPSIPSR